MDASILRIVSAIAQENVDDERYRKTGEEYAVVGKEDGRIGVVDEFGALHEISNFVEFDRDNAYNGKKDNGELRLKFGLQTMVVKWGLTTVDAGGKAQESTTQDVLFPKPFPNRCSTVLVTHHSNDPVSHVSALPKSASTFTISMNGGLNIEVFNYIAIGF